MLRYLEAIEELPANVRAPLLKVLDLFREEVAETVKKSDFEELRAVVERLAHSQEELAEAQKRTEQEIITLTKEFKAFKRQLGGVTDTIGYTLENEAFKALPALLKRDFDLKVERKLKRDFVEDIKGRLVEVNVLGKAMRDGEQIVIMGESKSQLSRKDVDNFLKRLKSIEPAMKGEKFLLMVTHMTRPEVAAYAREKGIKIYYSYEF